MPAITRMSPWQQLALWLLLCLAVAALGAWASVDARDFYAQLTQPRWAPPASVFGPVWTLLYLMMAIAAWQVAQSSAPARRLALALFLLQLALNGLWSWLFFAWHMGGAAFADIVVLWLVLLMTVIAFWKLHRSAGWLLAPYLAWVSFATALNYSVWQLNPGVL